MKGQLLKLAKKCRSQNKKYVIDAIDAEAGHRVVRLPPYHCQYNAVELIWTQVKSYVAKKNNFKMADLKHLVKEALLGVTPLNWAQAVKHAEQLQTDDANLNRAVDQKLVMKLHNHYDDNREIGLLGIPLKKKTETITSIVEWKYIHMDYN